MLCASMCKGLGCFHKTPSKPRSCQQSRELLMRKAMSAMYWPSRTTACLNQSLMVNGQHTLTTFLHGCCRASNNSLQVLCCPVSPYSYVSAKTWDSSCGISVCKRIQPFKQATLVLWRQSSSCFRTSPDQFELLSSRKLRAHTHTAVHGVIVLWHVQCQLLSY